MPTVFQFKQGYALFQAEFSRPAFDLLAQNLQRLLEQLVSHLAGPYGVGVGEFKVDQADGSVGRGHVSCPLLEFAATLRVFVERVEVESFYLERIGLERFRALAADAARAMAAVRGSEPFKTYTLDLGLHGRLLDVAPKEFLGRFLALRPQHRGPLMGSGCTLYFGQADEQLSASITADMSGPVKDGLFVRSRASWDASKLAADAVPELATEELKVALAGLDLTWQADSK